MKPLISIIIPIYQVEQYIRECLDSVIHQSLSNIEIICIDDCGKDESVAIVESYRKLDPRIIIVMHSRNKGLAQTRNSGLEVAQGDYVFFLDSDDFLEKDALEKLYVESQKSQADMVIARTKLIVDPPNVEGMQQKLSDIEKCLDFDVCSPYRVTLADFCSSLVSFPCIACGKLYSTSFLKAHSLKFIRSKVCHEDEGFHVKCLSVLPLVSMIEDVVLVYRLRGGSIMDENVKVENLQKRLKHVRASLYDAFAYIWRVLPFRDAVMLISNIQNHDSYAHYFTLSKRCSYIIIWTDREKSLRILGVELWKSKVTKSGRFITKILKIPVYFQRKRR